VMRNCGCNNCFQGRFNLESLENPINCTLGLPISCRIDSSVESMRNELQSITNVRTTHSAPQRSFGSLQVCCLYVIVSDDSLLAVDIHICSRFTHFIALEICFDLGTQHE
jgi:hypothetical protein